MNKQINYEQRAIAWAENYGIVEYKVKGRYMVYNKSYNAYLNEPRYTIQHTVDLNTMTELPTKRLKRFDPKGRYNTM